MDKIFTQWHSGVKSASVTKAVIRNCPNEGHVGTLLLLFAVLAQASHTQVPPGQCEQELGA